MRLSRIILFGVAALGLAFPPVSPARGERAAASPENETPPDDLPNLPGFSSDQMQRLRELRAWLQARKLQRLNGGVAQPEVRPRRQAVIDDERQLLTPLGQRYALGFEKYRPRRETPILRIGRGPDGRIHHQYVFPDEEQADTEMEAEADTELPATPPAKSRRRAGTIAARKKVVRVWSPEPLDQRISPRLDYDIEDPRR